MTKIEFIIFRSFFYILASFYSIIAFSQSTNDLDYLKLLPDSQANSIAEKISVSGKKWICKEYKIGEIENVMNKFRLSKIQAAILLNRSVYLDQIENFLRPTFKDLFPDPNSLQNMGNVSNIIVSAILKKKKIGIIGDYDVDGATSAALLYNYFLAIGIEAIVFIPDRVKDGYGVKKNAIDLFLKKKY